MKFPHCSGGGGRERDGREGEPGFGRPFSRRNSKSRIGVILPRALIFFDIYGESEGKKSGLTNFLRGQL